MPQKLMAHTPDAGRKNLVSLLTCENVLQVDQLLLNSPKPADTAYGFILDDAKGLNMRYLCLLFSGVPQVDAVWLPRVDFDKLLAHDDELNFFSPANPDRLLVIEDERGLAIYSPLGRRFMSARNLPRMTQHTRMNTLQKLMESVLI